MLFLVETQFTKVEELYNKHLRHLIDVKGLLQRLNDNMVQLSSMVKLYILGIGQ